MNTGTARVIEANHWRADLHGLVHDFANLLGMRLRQCPAVHSEVLAVNKDQAAVDHAVAGDDTVTGDFVVLHTEVGAAVLHKHIPLFKGALVQ